MSNTYDGIRSAIHSEIKALTAELTKLEKVLVSLDLTVPSLKLPKSPKLDLSLPKKVKAPRRIRLAADTRADISGKIVKAAKAHGKDGASKANIIKYLATNGYEVGHHFNLPHMFDILNALRDGDDPKITTTGEKARMRYHAT